MAKTKDRLVCELPGEAKRAIEAYSLELSLKNGAMSKAYRKLLALAYASPDAPIRDFGGDDLTCTLDVKVSEIGPLQDYQTHHRIRAQRPGFRNALLRGLSIHLDQRAVAAKAAADKEAAKSATKESGEKKGDGVNAESNPS